MPYESLIRSFRSVQGGGRLKNLLSTVLLLLSFLIFCLGYGLISVPVRAAPKTEVLWGISQVCDSEISNPENSLDGPKVGFDGKTAGCSMEGKKPSWTMDRFERPNGVPLGQVHLELGFYVSSWNDQDVLVLQTSNNRGKTWTDLERFGPSHPAPIKLVYLEVDAASVYASPASLRKAQVRLIYLSHAPQGESSLIFIDGARLVGIPEKVEPTSTSTSIPTSTNTAAPVETELSPSPTISTTEGTDSTSTPTPTLFASQVIKTPLSTRTPVGQKTPIVVTGTITASVPVTPVSSMTITPTLTITPTATPTPQPVDNNVGRGQVLWAVDQTCNFPIDHPENSLDQNFNDQMASCSGAFAGQQASWQFLAFQSTAFTHIDEVRLDMRLSVAGWIDDRLDLEVFDGAQWQKIDQFAPDHTIPPAGIANLSYPLTGLLQSPEMINQVKVRLVGVSANQTADSITIALDGARLIVSGGEASLQAVGPIATPGGLSLAVVRAAGSGDPHGDFSITTDSCAGCHRSHTGQGSQLRESWPEEVLCFGCHGTAGPGTSVQPAFSNNLNTATRYFSHPVNGTNNIHSLNETTGSSFGGSNRHIECEDCHDPHQAGRGSALSPALQAEMTGASGVDPVWTGAGTPASYSWLASATREYQVCFKCHSSYTALPSYAPDGWFGSSFVANGLRKLTSGNPQQVIDSRDMAREFNPYQASFHPVAAPGRNTNIPAGSFVSGWTQNSLVYCSDCHQNANPATGGSGPHGSPLLHLLGGSSNYSTVMQDKAPRVPSTQVCFNCHSYATYVTGQNQSTNFSFHSKHMNNDWGTTCYTCHDSHGSEQLHLINFDASVVTFPSNRNSQTAWYYDPVSQTAGCFLSCHGVNHNPYTYHP